MKLIPFLRFGNSPGEEEQNEEFSLPPDELVEPPTDEETEEAEEEEKPEEEEAREDKDDRAMGNDDEMLKVFMTAEEEFVDNSGLAAQLDDVPAAELLQELRVLASAFGIRVEATQDEAA